MAPPSYFFFEHKLLSPTRTKLFCAALTTFSCPRAPPFLLPNDQSFSPHSRSRSRSRSRALLSLALVCSRGGGTGYCNWHGVSSMGKTLIPLPFVTQGRERAVAWTCSKSCGWFLGGVMMIVGRGCWTCPNPFEEYSSCHKAVVWFDPI